MGGLTGEREQPPEEDLERLDRETCLDLLGSVEVGRIAWFHRGNVFVFPLNFALERDAATDSCALVVRTSSETICRAATSEAAVSFQADDFEPAVRTGWTVLAHGDISEVTDPAEVSRLSALVQPWRSDRNLRLLRLRLDHITGRRLRLHPGRIETLRLEP